MTGGRHYNDRNTVGLELQIARLDLITHLPLSDSGTEPPTLVHGGASGADQLAADVARQAGWRIEEHPADWGTHGRAAGPIRNQNMAAAGGDLLIAFPGGRGTANMIRCAEAAGIPVRRVA